MMPRLIFLVSLLLLIYMLSRQAPSTIKIMPLGDSITQSVGNDNASALGLDSYRRALYKLLTEANYQVDFVGSMKTTYRCGEAANQDFDTDHEGHWGWRVDEIINGKNTDCSGVGKLSEWLQLSTPDIALVHLGTNDALQGQSDESTLGELEMVIDILREANPKITILLAKLLPVFRPEQPYLSQRVKSLTDKIHLVAQRKDTSESHVLIVGQHNDFDASKETYDGIHPNQLGEQKMAIRWFKAIERYWPK